MTVSTTPPIPRWRLITFWVLMMLLLFLHLGDRPEQLGYVFSAFGGFPDGAGATHEIHWFAQGVFAWAILAAVVVQLRRPAAQVGAAWVYGAGTVVMFGMVLALADLPSEVVPIVAAAIVIAGIAFAVHPSTRRARYASVERPSPSLSALVAVAAVPLIGYAIGQLDIHANTGPHDEHHEFGHWIVMAVYALLALLFGAVAARKVSGWRFPLWTSGLMVAALGLGSLGINAVSQLSTVWAVLAIAWGTVLIGAGELQARSGLDVAGPHEATPTEQRHGRSRAGAA